MTTADPAARAASTPPIGIATDEDPNLRQGLVHEHPDSGTHPAFDLLPGDGQGARPWVVGYVKQQRVSADLLVEIPRCIDPRGKRADDNFGQR